jgi:hypothetical protein
MLAGTRRNKAKIESQYSLIYVRIASGILPNPAAENIVWCPELPRSFD